MLVRNNPFKEWVTVYFDPAKISEKKLLQLLRERRCPRATLDRVDGDLLTAMNPFVGPGGIVQLRLEAKKDRKPSPLTLPKGWTLVGDAKGVVGQDHAAYFSVQVSANAKPGKHEITATTTNGKPRSTTVEVVRRIGG